MSEICSALDISMLGLSLQAVFPKQALVFYVATVQVTLKTPWEKEKLLLTSNFTFSHRVFYPFDALLAIFTKLKLSSAKSLSLGKSKICRLGKG